MPGVATANIKMPKMGRLMAGGVQYWQKMINLLAPSHYWPLWDGVGATGVQELVKAGNGTPTGVTFGGAGIGDGKTAGAFSVLGNSRINIYSAALNADLPKTDGWATVWGIFPDAAAWTDALGHKLLYIAVDGNNRIFLSKDSNNTLVAYYIAGSTVLFLTQSRLSTTQWWQLFFTWSKVNNRIRLYLNGVPTDNPSTAGLGNWVGNLDSTMCGIGSARGTSALQPFAGRIAHVMIGSGEPSPAIIAAAYPYGQIILEGDSRSYQKSWIFEAHAAISSRLGIQEVSAAGKTLDQMIAGVATNIAPKFLPGKTNTVILWGGVNNSGDTAEVLYNKTVTVCQAVRALGMRVIDCTEIDAQDATRLADNWPTKYLDLNTMKRNDPSYCTALADLGANPNLQNANNAAMFVDKVHLTAAGNTVAAGVVAPVMASVAGS